MGTRDIFYRGHIAEAITRELDDWRFTYRERYIDGRKYWTHEIEAWFTIWTIKITRRYADAIPRLMTIEVIDIDGVVFHSWVGVDDEEIVTQIGDIANTIVEIEES